MIIGMAALLLVAAAVGWMTGMPGRSHSGPPAPPSPAHTELQDRLVRHVQVLAQQIGERNTGRPHTLAEAARYLEQRLRESGHAVAREGVQGGELVHNLIVERRGSSRPEEIVLVGAHYDSVYGSPGADDNATGTAALLEIARWLAGQWPARTVRCVFFVNEEPPLFRTQWMGSRVHARHARDRGENIVAMLSIESIGYYTDHEDSQHYPFPFGMLYPSKGNFVGFVGNLSSRGLVRRTIGCFRRNAHLPSEGLAAPAFIPGIGWSDHWAFWQEGYPAVMITDTAPFRYGPYHTRADRPEQVRYVEMAEVVGGLLEVVADLAGAGPAAP
jgi:hypothetical protein